MRKNSLMALCACLMCTTAAINLMFIAASSKQAPMVVTYAEEKSVPDVGEGDSLASVAKEEYVTPTYTFEELFEGVFAGNGSVLPSDYQYYGFSDTDKRALRTKCDEIIGSVTSEKMSELEKIKAIHDYLVLHTYYDMTYKQHDALDTLTNGIAVCSGYSSAFQALMERLGIECKTISGMNHAWNAVKMDGAWYYVDVTWDDPLLNGISSDYPDGRNLKYDYFLVPYSMISRDHDFESLLQPEGTSTQYYEWVCRYSSQQKIESFADILRTKGYGEIIFVDVDTDEMEDALKRLVENGREANGCVVAYYKNVPNPHYTLPVFYVNGQKYATKIHEWAQDYYYIMLTAYDVPDVIPGNDTDEATGQENSTENGTDNSEVPDNTDVSDDGKENENDAKENEDSKDQEEDDSTGGSIPEEDGEKDMEQESDKEDTGKENGEGPEDNSDDVSDNGENTEDGPETFVCDPRDDAAHAGYASVGGGMNIGEELSEYEPYIEQPVPESCTVSDAGWDCSSEVVNGVLDEPF